MQLYCICNNFFFFVEYISQAIHLKYQHPESELQTFALQVMDMLRADTSVDAHALVLLEQFSTFRVVFSILLSLTGM